MTSRLSTSSGTSIPLRGVEVVGDILGGHAHISVRQRYRNGESRPVEAVYTFPLPSDGTLVGFSMACDGRTIEGVVKEREAAFKAYDDAVLDGHGAALVDEERRNVFTAQVGNLLPGEETTIEMRYIQRLQADEGALRVMIPTLVAPRYIPGGGSAGDRTAHGTAEPTPRVPDADRITPPIGGPDYGLSVELTFDLGRELEIESPSHEVTVTHEGGKSRLTLRRADVPLDRDLVVTARGVASGPTAAAVLHRDGDEGFVALTVVPDLGGAMAAPLDVVFVVDVSGSMQGASIEQARAALRLCLRHLREGDRFNVIQFSDKHSALFERPEPFAQRTLDRADDWVAKLVASGGTEMLRPLLEAVEQAPRGVVVLLTDGQVGNEDEILREVLETRKTARIYTFGIGTNVSDVLLRDLAKRSGGAVELIHPGERLDEKVVAQFARAGARRVTGVKVDWKGVEALELAPSEPTALVDNEPWVLYGRTRGRGVGEAEIHGELDGKPFYLALPIDLEGARAQPLLPKLWAAERVNALEVEGLSGRRADRMKERIVEIGVKYGIATRYTSFVAVETRTGARRASGYPETRVIPVHAPAGWGMFDRRARADQMRTRAGGVFPGAPMPTMMASPMYPGAYCHTPAAASAPAKSKGIVAAFTDILGGLPPPPSPPQAMPAQTIGHVTSTSYPTADPIAALLQAQRASGLWGGADGDDELQARATARALVQLLRAGVGAAHPIHGAQLKKAIDAVRLLGKRLVGEPVLRELLLSVAWLLADGKRLRKEVAADLGGSADEGRLRSRVDELAATI